MIEKLRNVGWSGQRLPAKAESFGKYEQDYVIDRQQRPDQQRNADQSSFGLVVALQVGDFISNRFIMKYKGAPAAWRTIDAIDMSTSSRRR